MYRIPGKLGEKPTAGKPPILLGHCLDIDMMEYVVNYDNVAPAFHLAENGYDVWLGNNRGNRFSDTHISLTKDQKEYWNFDWEDMGTGDVPAMFDYILEETGVEKLSYIGHSQGTTQILAGGSLLPEYYKSKLNVALLMAPPASVNNTTFTVFQFAANKFVMPVLEVLADLFGVYNFLPYNFLFSHGGKFLCGLFNGKLCDYFLGVIMDADVSVDDTSRYDLYMSNVPSGAPLKSWIHYG